MPDVDNLPHGPAAMVGLWPNAILKTTMLDHPVLDDAGAEFVMSWAAYLEARKAQIQAWCEKQVAEVERAITILAESAATKSLAEYVKVATGRKTLELPSGTIKVRVQRDILRVYDERGVLEVDPTLSRVYQAPPRTLLDKGKLKDILKKSESHKMILGGGDQSLVVAELVPEVETVSCQPSSRLPAVPVAEKLLAAELQEPNNEDSHEGE